MEKNERSEKEKSFEAKTGRKSRMKIAGVPTEFPTWEYVRALEAQDERRKAENADLATKLHRIGEVVGVSGGSH